MANTLRHLLCAPALVAVLSIAARADDATFARTTIDLGTLVSNIEQSVKFYTEVIGFKEAQGFSVAAELTKDAGLDDQPLKIRVLVLGDGPTATKLKMMEVPGVETAKGNPSMIHSQLGYRYITIFVTDLSAALERLTKANVKPLAKGPIPIPGAGGAQLAVVRDPDGNLIELIGPRK
jgi:catechol 2,3-dioxygenase-like lactoylglutathione lyase family enzyme